MIGVELCDRCGFDRSQWNEQDAKRTLAQADELLAGWSVDARPELEARLLAYQLDDMKAIESSPDLYDEVHHLWHGLVAIADLRRKADDAVPRQTGSIAQISSSSGGVPKTAITEATIGVRGVDGDVQETRAHHGRPYQALCLWSAEVVDAFAADGHPIAYGSCGENLTLAGLDWSSMRAGTIIEIGEGPDAVRLQLSGPTEPCSKNSGHFLERDINLMDHDRNPGHSRWYASVLQPGSISTGDSVTVSPD